MHRFCRNIKNIPIVDSQAVTQITGICVVFASKYNNAAENACDMLWLQVHGSHCTCFLSLFRTRTHAIPCPPIAHRKSLDIKSKQPELDEKLAFWAQLGGPPPPRLSTVPAPLSWTHGQEGIAILADVSDLLSLTDFRFRFTEE